MGDSVLKGESAFEGGHASRGEKGFSCPRILKPRVKDDDEEKPQPKFGDRLTGEREGGGEEVEEGVLFDGGVDADGDGDDDGDEHGDAHECDGVGQAQGDLFKDGLACAIGKTEVAADDAFACARRIDDAVTV